MTGLLRVEAVGRWRAGGAALGRLLAGRVAASIIGLQADHRRLRLILALWLAI